MRSLRISVPVALLAMAALCLSITTSQPMMASEAKKDTALPMEGSDSLRNFTLETDEVTWLSASLTPEGDVVVDVLGDLYRIPGAGGPADQITEGMGFDDQPAVSPDGTMVAFISDRDGAENLWIMRLDEDEDGKREPRKLTKESTASFASPTWSPDSQYIYFSKMGKGKRTYELFTVNRNGGSGVQITQAAEDPSTPRNRHHNALGAAASADGKYLYYARRSGGFSYNLDFPAWQVARRDLVTGEEDTITSAQGSAVRPAISPDGRWLTFATRLDNQTGIKIRDLESGDERWLAYPVQRDEQESLFSRDLYPGYSFTSDGTALIISWGGKLHRLDVATGNATDIPFSVKIDQKIAPLLDFPRRIEEGPIRARTVQGATAAPGTDTVAFSALTRLYTTDGSGSEQISPVGQRAFQPAWSADGQWLAYVTWERDGGHVWKVPSSGGTPQQLTTAPAFYTQPVWTPDGSTIVCLRGGRHQRLEMPAEFGRSPLALDLVSVPAAGGNATLLAPSRGVAKPHFGPETDRIYVVSGGGLTSMRLDGTDKRHHLEVKGPGFYSAAEPVPAQEIQIHPKGGWALAKVSNRFYVVAVPQIGGKAPTVNIDSPSVPIKQISDLGADVMQWADGGDTIAWAVGSTFYKTTFADLDFSPKPPAEADESESDDTEGEGAEGNDAEAEEEEASSDAPDFPEATSIDLVAEVQRSEPEGSVLLTGARIITMNGEEVFEQGDILIEGRRIQAVGSTGSLEIPGNAKRIDVSGKTVVPGFIDTHAHWTQIRRGVLDVESWPFLASLAWGVTTGLDVQTMSNDMFAYQDLIDAGEVLGPRAYSTGPGVFSDNDFKTKEQAEAILRRYRDHYGTKNLKAYLSGNRKQRQLLAQAAFELEMMPTTEGGLDLELDLTHALDGFAGNEHSLPVVPLYSDVVQLFAQGGTSYTPTLLVAYGGPWAENAYYTRDAPHDNPRLRRFMPHDLLDGSTRKRAWFRPDEHVFPMLAESAARIQRAGGRVGVGAHGQLQGLGYHWEMESFAAGGMTPREVLKAATIDGANIIGLEQDLGSLEPGKIADLVVLTKNPLDNVQNTNSVEMVMKNGELYDAETLDQIHPTSRPLPEQWWWSAWPGTEVEP